MTKNDHYLLAIILYRVIVIDFSRNHTRNHNHTHNHTRQHRINIEAINAITQALYHRARMYPLWWKVMLKLHGLLVPNDPTDLIDEKLFGVCQRCIRRHIGIDNTEPLKWPHLEQKNYGKNVTNAFHHHALLPQWAKKLLPTARHGPFLFYHQPNIHTVQRYEQQP